MKRLLDTHALIWFVDQDHLLAPLAHAEIMDPANELLLSAASIWEIGIKVGLGKLKLSSSFRVWIENGSGHLFDSPRALGSARELTYVCPNQPINLRDQLAELITRCNRTA